MSRLPRLFRCATPLLSAALLAATTALADPAPQERPQTRNATRIKRGKDPCAALKAENARLKERLERLESLAKEMNRLEKGLE